jgi:HPt (histidine-containing phosphotransfer) domain-containing protein
VENSPHVIDAAVIDMLCDALGPDGMAELVATFRDHTPGLLAEAREAHARADWEAAQTAVHGLKGAAASMGLTRLANIARHAERAYAEGRPADALARLAETEAALAAGLAALAALTHPTP